jgi:hypothetical protein
MAGRKNREFSERVKEQLRERVAFMCSNPLCRRLTVKAAFEGNDSVRSGDAAHIHSAGKGPRFDPAMTNHECRAFENGIWLCSNCAREVDDNNSQYSAATLRKWKADAEEYVQGLVTQDTRLRQLQDMVSGVLTSIRILTALPGPDASFDQTFHSSAGIPLTRTLIESEQLLFERGFREEADSINKIRGELTSLYRDIEKNQTAEYLDISKWKNGAIHTVMCGVMRFSEESYERYRNTESLMVNDRISEIVERGERVRESEIQHSPLSHSKL